MQILVPYTPISPKTRLAPVLNESERREFADRMLQDVLRVIRRGGYRATVLSTAELDVEGASVRIDDRSLSTAVNEAIDPPTAIVMADLPLLTAEVLTEALSTPGDVVLNPGRGGGTNLLVVRKTGFSTDFHGASIRDHRRIATASGMSCTELDSFRIATDIDEPDDLVEVLLHSDGGAARWLRDHGFSVQTTAGRVSIERST